MLLYLLDISVGDKSRSTTEAFFDDLYKKNGMPIVNICVLSYAALTNFHTLVTGLFL